MITYFTLVENLLGLVCHDTVGLEHTPSWLCSVVFYPHSTFTVDWALNNMERWPLGWQCSPLGVHRSAAPWLTLLLGVHRSAAPWLTVQPPGSLRKWWPLTNSAVPAPQTDILHLKLVIFHSLYSTPQTDILHLKLVIFHSLYSTEHFETLKSMLLCAAWLYLCLEKAIWKGHVI